MEKQLIKTIEKVTETEKIINSKILNTYKDVERLIEKMEKNPNYKKTPSEEQMIFNLRQNQLQKEREEEMKKLFPEIPINKDIDYSIFIKESMPHHVPDILFRRPISEDTGLPLYSYDSEEAKNGYRNHANESMTNSRIKSECATEGMFAFVSWQWVRPLAEFLKDKKCLEVMAGRGWLSLALRKLGVNIIATDDFSWAKPDDMYWKMAHPVTEVEKLDAVKAVEKYSKDIDVIILSWPYMDNTAFQTIKRLNELNENALIIYIGEDWGGCTADDEFHAHLDYISDDEFNQINNKYQQWYGLHDTISLNKYKDCEFIKDED